MAKQKPEVTIRSYGLYSKWDSDAKELPRFLESTTRIPAKVDVEFGLMIHVTGGKNLPMRYCIAHPGILDSSGQRRPPFEDVVYIKSNDWDFYLGDTIWEPISDKLGIWRMTLELEDSIIADQSFEIYHPRIAKPFRHRYRLLRIAWPRQ